MPMKCEIRYWKNDQIKSQIAVEADSLEQAIRSDAPITITRQRGEDASAIAARAARAAGTTLAGNLRWFGAAGPAYRAIGTADGRTIRVVEPADYIQA